MSWKSKVAWSEGMFLRPQHFQQQERFLEHIVQSRSAHLTASSWGFTQLKIDRQALSLGKIVLESCQGVLPDGTVIDIPDVDAPPPPLDIPADAKEITISLGLPLFRPGTANLRHSDQDEGLERFLISEIEVKDNIANSTNKSALQIARPTLRLLTSSMELNEFAHLGIARVVERRPDDTVVLADNFIPPCLDCRVSSRLIGFVEEIEGLLHHRGEALAARLSSTAKGIAEVTDFLLLEVVNRFEPLLSHLGKLETLHPERFYSIALQLAGDLATFTSQSKRPPNFAIYRHQHLEETFDPVIKELRRALSMVLEQKAIAIPLEERKFGIRVATPSDRSLLTSATFVLAANAQMSAELLQRKLPPQVKIGPVEKIRDLVNLQLPGVGLRLLPVAPREIPYNSGFSYFELDRSSEYWKMLETSGGCALHIGGEFPGIELELWAIKR